jgi:hypothetical protein
MMEFYGIAVFAQSGQRPIALVMRRRNGLSTECPEVSTEALAALRYLSANGFKFIRQGSRDTKLQSID